MFTKESFSKFLEDAAARWGSDGKIPVYEAGSINSRQIALETLGMRGPGVCVVRSVFSEDLMSEIKDFVERYYENTVGRERKKDHFAKDNKRIWRFPEKIPAPQLFSLLSNTVANCILDEFLGCWHIGSLAINTVTPGGAAQKLHSDYPPGFFSPVQIDDHFSHHQLENVFPYFSLQAAIAVDRITPENGATEFIPFSHQLPDSDRLVLDDKLIENVFEHHVVSLRDGVLADGHPYLEPGDVVFFNRKVLHRGGANRTESMRTALLLQAVMPFGAKMEALNAEQVWKELKNYIQSDSIAVSEKEMRKLRFRLFGQDFPRDLDGAEVDEENS